MIVHMFARLLNATFHTPVPISLTGFEVQFTAKECPFVQEKKERKSEANESQMVHFRVILGAK
jgi:hypothetical protein